MKKTIPILFVFVLLCGCGSSSQRIMSVGNAKKFRDHLQIFNQLPLIGSDTLINNRFYRVNESGGMETGILKNGHKKGKWFYYKKEADTLTYYKIEKYKKNDTILVWIDRVYNPRFW